MQSRQPSKGCSRKTEAFKLVGVGHGETADEAERQGGPDLLFILAHELRISGARTGLGQKGDTAEFWLR